ncbi:MAG: PilW family protein [Gammaproteobacteria bacterium]
MSLIELLVATLLAIILTGTVVDVFLLLEKTEHNQSELMHVSRNLDVAVKNIRQDVYQAGACGCRSAFHRDMIINHVVGYKDFFDKKNLIRIDKANDLTIHAAENKAVSVLLSSAEMRWQLFVGTNVVFSNGDVVVVSDCEFAEIAKVMSSYHAFGFQLLVFNVPLIHEYKLGAQVSRLERRHYFIKSDNLYLETISDRSDVLIDNVQSADFSLRGDMLKARLQYSLFGNKKTLEFRGKVNEF